MRTAGWSWPLNAYVTGFSFCLFIANAGFCCNAWYCCCEYVWASGFFHYCTCCVLLPWPCSLMVPVRPSRTLTVVNASYMHARVFYEPGLFLWEQLQLPVYGAADAARSLVWNIMRGGFCSGSCPNEAKRLTTKSLFLLLSHKWSAQRFFIWAKSSARDDRNVVTPPHSFFGQYVIKWIVPPLRVLSSPGC